jgi:hypothetical protein
MLTSEQSIVEFKGSQVFTDRLNQGAHRHYIDYAEQMLSVYTNGIGKQRRWLHREIENLFQNEADCPIRRIAAFCKLLDDKSIYHTDPGGNAAKLRLEVFSKAARFHPLVGQKDKLFEYAEADVKERISQKLGLPWNDVEQNLYSDVIEYQRLKEFAGYTDATAFLCRYNVAQLQACLYRAETMKIWASDDFKTILRYAKLAKLLHQIRRTGPSKYEITLSGPVSVLHESRRYGVNFAKFLPALLACKDWKMSAVVKTPWKTRARVNLSDKDGFTSYLPCPDEFDSSVEQTFASKFGKERDGWQLVREGGILYENQTTFVPDFAFRHKDGTEVFLEIVGFWTPEYLAHRRETLLRFRECNIILAVAEKSLKKDVSGDSNIISYKTALKLAPVLKALEAMRKTNTKKIKK